jgi:hypothetical protein
MQIKLRTTSTHTYILVAFSFIIAIGSVSLPALSVGGTSASFSSYGSIMYQTTVLKYTGIGEDYLFWTGNPESWNSTLTDFTGAPVTALQKISQWKFNTVRLCFAFPNSNSKTHSILDLAKMDRVIELIASTGAKVILGCHNVDDMVGFFGSQAWIDNWVQLSQKYKGDQRILAFEIFNEPWAMGESPWFQNQDLTNQAITRCIDAIRAVDPSRMIVYPWLGIVPNYAGSNMLYTLHTWTWTTDDATTITEAQNFINNVIVPTIAKYGAANVWVGEIGTSSGSIVFIKTLINACVEKGASFNLHMYKDCAYLMDAALQQSTYK